MNEEKLYNAITKIDEKLLDRSLNRRKPFPRKTVFAVSAAVLVLCSLLFVLPLFDRDDVPVKESPEDLPDLKGGYPFISVERDWPWYSTPREIAGASTDIYSGIIKDISFEIIDTRTGKPNMTCDSTDTSKMLYTVYTVEVIHYYKGEAGPVKTICVDGGLRGYNEKEQYGLLKRAGLSESYGGIPIAAESRPLDIGGEYLFCTVRCAGMQHDFIINPEQFADNVDSETSSSIICSIQDADP